MAEEINESVETEEVEQASAQVPQESTEKTFTQDELNAIVQDAKAKAKRAAEKEYKAQLDEAEKLRKMNAEQKAEYEAQKQADRIAELEAQLNRTGLEKEAIFNAREVLEIFTIMFEDKHKEMPRPSSFKALANELTSDKDIIQAISVDTDLVRERERSKTVNKTVTLPSWLVEVGKENKVNFSQLLQKAIREELQV